MRTRSGKVIAGPTREETGGITLEVKLLATPWTMKSTDKEAEKERDESPKEKQQVYGHNSLLEVMNCRVMNFNT